MGARDRVRCAAACASVLAAVFLGAVVAPAAAQETRPLSSAEEAEFRAELGEFAALMDPFNERAIARRTPRRIVASEATAQGVSVEDAMAAKVETASIAGFRVVGGDVVAPSSPVIAVETGDVLCVVLSASYERRIEGGRRTEDVDLLAIRDEGRWDFMLAARSPWRKVQLRRVYGAFICSHPGAS